MELANPPSPSDTGGLSANPSEAADEPTDGSAASRDESVRVERFRRQGVTLLDPGLALTAIRTALRDATPVVVADIDWADFAPAYAAIRPGVVLSEVARTVHERDRGALTEPELRRQLAEAGAEERRDMVATLVRDEVAAVLGDRDPARLPDRGLLELGFDSLTSVELRKRLNRATGVSLPLRVFTDNPNPAYLAALPAAEVATATSGAPVPDATPTTRTTRTTHGAPRPATPPVTRTSPAAPTAPSPRRTTRATPPAPTPAPTPATAPTPPHRPRPRPRRRPRPRPRSRHERGSARRTSRRRAPRTTPRHPAKPPPPAARPGPPLRPAPSPRPSPRQVATAPGATAEAATRAAS